MKDLSGLKKPNPDGIFEEPEKKEQTVSPPKKQGVAGKGKLGRMPLKDEEKKTEVVKAYLSPAEKEIFEQKLAELGHGFKIPESQFIRKLLSDNGLI